MLKLKLQYFGHLMQRVDSLEKDPDAGRDWGQEEKGKTEDEMAGWHHWLDGCWVWVNSGSWWWTGRPGVLQFMGSQRVGHDWATELNWIPVNGITVLSVIQAHDLVVKQERRDSNTEWVKSLWSLPVYSIPPVGTLPQGAVIYVAQWAYTVIIAEINDMKNAKDVIWAANDEPNFRVKRIGSQE